MTDEFDPTNPWLAKELLRQAEAAAKARVDGLNKTKDRAAGLLTWSLTVSSAVIAFSTHAWSGGKIAYGQSAAILIAGMAAVCILCVCVLTGTEMRPAWIYPVDIETLCKERGVVSEAQLQVVIADELAMRDFENFATHSRKQRLLKWAWRASVASPIVSLLTAAFLR